MKRIKGILILLSVSMMLFSCSAKNSDNIAEARQAIVFQFLEGEGVMVIRDDLQEKGYEGMRLLANDKVSTDADTSVYLRVDNDKNILLGKSTTMEVTELKSGKLSLTLLEGEFFFDVVNALKEDETMDFNISNASMSIRGTSGAGKFSDDETAMLTIYTGLGVLTQKSDSASEGEQPKEFQIAPGTKAVINTNPAPSTNPDEPQQQPSIQLEAITVFDVPEVMKEYVATNETYQEKLQEQNWRMDEDGDITVPPIDTVPASDEITEKESRKYVGWRQDQYGNWAFFQEDCDRGIGPTYYVAEVKGVVTSTTTSTVTIDPTYTCEHCHQEYKGSQSAYHNMVLSQSTPGISRYITTTRNLCGTHYLCEVGLEATEIAKHTECTYSDPNNPHCLCSENHIVCCECGKCNYADSNMTLYEGQYYCSGCYYHTCAHCHTTYGLAEAAYHDALLTKNNANLAKYTNANKDLCSTHYLCEVGIDHVDDHKACPDTGIGKHYCCSENHRTCDSEGCNGCIHAGNSNECTGCSKLYCNTCASTKIITCICEKKYCIDCYNPDHQTGLAYDCAGGCGNKLCFECADDNHVIECDVCGKIFCEFCSSDGKIALVSDGRHVCQGCSMRTSSNGVNGGPTLSGNNETGFVTCGECHTLFNKNSQDYWYEECTNTYYCESCYERYGTIECANNDSHLMWGGSGVHGRKCVTCGKVYCDGCSAAGLIVGATMCGEDCCATCLKNGDVIKCASDDCMNYICYDHISLYCVVCDNCGALFCVDCQERMEDEHHCTEALPIAADDDPPRVNNASTNMTNSDLPEQPSVLNASDNMYEFIPYIDDDKFHWYYDPHH